MFIPRGKPLYENLATSYVLVDALVSDLCEGGFSGLVELVLRQTEVFIVLSAGKMAAITETRGATDRGNNNSANGERITLQEAAARSRRERGRVSVYPYSEPTARAVAGRMNGQTLYTGLSTEFTDLNRMIRKLAREKDREWFIEVNSEGGLVALIHMGDSRCRIISSNADTLDSECDVADLTSNAAIARVLYECNRSGGTFDVYFQLDRADEEVEQQQVDQLWTAAQPVESSTENYDLNVARFEARLVSANSPLALESRLEHSEIAAKIQSDPPPAYPIGLDAAPQNGELYPGLSVDPAERERSLSLDVQLSGDQESMSEVKRLMSEFARTVEAAVQSVDRHDAFVMALRAGQLRIADRFPFLDPFAGEFEYLGGEIVFVGEAAPEEFIEGLTEALGIAVEEIARSNAYSDRLRSYLVEDLQKLRESNRAVYQKLGMEEAVEKIIAAQYPH